MTPISRSRPVRVTVVVALAALALFAWRSRTPRDEQAIRAQLEALRIEVNASTVGGLSNAARAAQLGSYFTDDAVVELGKGSPPIVGRDTLMGMAARLEPRTSAFRLEFDDIGVELAPGASTADVTLTASFVLRSSTTGEESRDAREFALALTRASGTWRVARVSAVDTLR